MVAKLLTAPVMLKEAPLAEKLLVAVCLLCRHGLDKQTSDEVNEKALAASGACEGGQAGSSLQCY